MGVLDKLLRVGEGKKLKALASLVPDVNALEPELQALSDDALRGKTGEFRQRLEAGEDLDDLLMEAFAVVREGARRVIGQRHYDVQLMGGAALHFGWVAEMKAREGKTLVSTLPAYLNGLSGRGMHLVTVNDYLARRDSEWMGQIHRWLGLSVGLIVPGDYDQEYKRRQTRVRPHVRHEQRVRLRLPPPTTWRPRPGEGAARARLRDRRRGRLDSHRRSAHPAHHQLGTSPRPRELYYRFASIVRSPRQNATTRSTRRSAPSPR